MQVVFQTDFRNYNTGDVVNLTDDVAEVLLESAVRGQRGLTVARRAKESDLKRAADPPRPAAERLRSVKFVKDWRNYNSGDVATFVESEAGRLVQGSAAVFARPESKAEEPPAPPEEKKMVRLLKDYGNLNADDVASFPISECARLVRDRTAEWASPEGEEEAEEPKEKVTRSPKTKPVKGRVTKGK